MCWFLHCTVTYRHLSFLTHSPVLRYTWPGRGIPLLKCRPVIRVHRPLSPAHQLSTETMAVVSCAWGALRTNARSKWIAVLATNVKMRSCAWVLHVEYEIDPPWLQIIVSRGQTSHESVSARLCLQWAGSLGILCRSSAGGTVNKEETQRLEGVPWWDPSGPMAALHTMNTLRVPLIKNTLQGFPPDDITTLDQVPHPLQGWSVLDVGCGAGILSEVCHHFPSQTFDLCSHTRLISVQLETGSHLTLVLGVSVLKGYTHPHTHSRWLDLVLTSLALTLLRQTLL